MQRHDGRLGEAENVEPVGQAHEHRIGGRRKDAVNDVADMKVQGAAEDIGKDQGRQEKELAGTDQVNQIFLRSGVGFEILVMRDQGIGEQGDDFVKQVQGEDIAGKGDALGTEDGDREAKVVPRLGVFLEGTHVADVVGRGHPPQEAGDDGEDHGQPVGHERYVNSRKDGKKRVGQHLAMENVRHHGQDREEGQRAGHKGDRLALVRFFTQ